MYSNDEIDFKTSPQELLSRGLKVRIGDDDVQDMFVEVIDRMITMDSNEKVYSESLYRELRMTICQIKRKPESTAHSSDFSWKAAVVYHAFRAAIRMSGDDEFNHLMDQIAEFRVDKNGDFISKERFHQDCGINGLFPALHKWVERNPERATQIMQEQDFVSNF